MAAVIQDNTEVRDIEDVLAETGEDTPVEGSDYGENNEKLPDNLQTALLALAKKFANQDKQPRRAEVREARLQRHYWQGEQHIYWSDNESCFIAAPGSGVVNRQESDVELPRFMHTFNIFMPYMRILISALTQNAPGIRFEPQSRISTPDIKAAATAEQMKVVIERNNDMKKLQADAARLFCTDGRVAIHTEYVRDGQQYGFKDQLHVDESPEGIQNPQAPRQANGQEKFTAYGVLEVKVPILLNDFADFPYLLLSVEKDITQAKAMFPDIADSIQEGSSSLGDSEFERMARLGVLQGKGRSTDGYDHVVTIHKMWLRPSAFMSVPEGDREELQELFPDGCYVCFVGEKYAESRNECMDDHWAVKLAMPADGQRGPSLGKGLVPIQDVFNDLQNLRLEYYNQCVPTTWYDSELIDVDAMDEQVNLPGNRMPVKKRPNQEIAQSFYTEEQIMIPADMIQAIAYLQGELAQFITAALPSLSGGQMEGNDTASGYAMARDQAMGQMGLVWAALQTLWAQIMLQAVRCAAYNRAQESQIEVPQGGGQVDPTALAIADLKGDFLCFPDKDSSFPDTWSAKRNVLMQLLNMAGSNPALASTLTQPDNLSLMKDVIGLEDLYIEGDASRDKQLREISQLLKQVPIPDTQKLQMAALARTAAKVAGQPLPPLPQPEDMSLPSIPIDPVFDNHQFEFEEVQRWLNSEEGNSTKLTNPKGWMNVRLHGLAHYQQIQAAAAKNAPQPKPPSEAINFKDLPPDGQVQMAKQVGIDLQMPPAGVPQPPQPGAAPAPAQ